MDQYYRDNFEEILDIFCRAAGGGAFSVRLDDELTLLSANESYYKIFGCTKDGLFQQTQNKFARSIYPDDAERVLALCREARESGALRLECELRIITAAGNIKRVKAAGAIDRTHTTPVARGVLIDLFAQSSASGEENLSYKSIVEENIMGSFRLNLSQNLCGDGQCIFPYVLKLRCAKTVDEFFGMVYEEIPDAEQRARHAALFNRENLLASFDAGITHLHLEHKYRVDENRCQWLATHITITKNPATDDIEALIYTFDIHRTKTLQLIMEHTVESDYDYIAVVNTADESHMEIMNDKSPAVAPPVHLKKYSEVIAGLVALENAPEDRERIERQKSLQNVVEQLRESDCYTITYAARQKDGSVGHKRLRFSYLDRDEGLIVFSATDITREIAEEQQKNEMLRDALTAAKQANSAKTDFLSRMSHEIRTPMNAIMGMAAIAAQSIGDEEQVSDCISKIGISSRFLLSLINDILDMSRIESGKVLLKNEKVPFAELIGSINSICYSQAKAKDIDYECVVDNHIEASYMGDAMKLQQVLINILSNSIKFTDSKGRVSMEIKQLKRTGTHAELRFSINDTGCGISEEFIPQLFEPFSQEHAAGFKTMYSGTGLGLAICKNLVEMMDGKIEVRSIVDVGTEFTVTLKLGVTEETTAGYFKKMSHNFERLNTLVVDDDVAVCQYTVITLSEMGMKAEWIDSGKKAVERVREKWDEGAHYDLILVDWKMPEMDGIETARAIRAIVGPEVTIIIMTAYDWASIEHEARLAGVNMLISKPLFKSSLASAFSKALDEKHVEEIMEEPVDFDFSGHRILVVEDHPLNIEVARKLLERKGFAVDQAENGLRAIEMITLAPEKYYDAVLMDIRMPVMDGLQATRGIRNLHKKSAKTVPIIAMTANAFDDDVEKSRNAGMNAHLTKPIEPAHLYRTLYHYISGEEDTAK
ncbi:MAG: response regulator [Cloacibacillus sp.]